MRRPVTLIAAVALSACTAASDDTPGECLNPVEPVLTGELAAGTAASPYPSDLYTVEAGTPTGLRNDVSKQGLLFEALVNHADGWAPHGAIRILFSGGVTGDTLPLTVTASTQPDAAIQLIDTQTHERMPFRLFRGNEADRFYLLPFGTLLEERRYAVVVRDNAQPIVGGCLRRNTDFARILRGDDPAGFRAHATAAMREIYTDFKAHAADLGFDAASIALLAPYTTQSVTRDLIALREEVTAAPITAFTLKSYPAMVSGAFNPDLAAIFPPLPSGLEFGVDAKLDNVAHIVLGYFKSQDYRKDCAVAFGEYLWQPTPQCEDTLQFLLTIPKRSAIRAEYRAKVDAEGKYPVIIFGHGLTACKETALAVVNVFAEYGFAVAGIDVVEHGTRNYNPTTGQPNDPLDGCGETIREGLRILRGAQPELARDNFRQTALDEIQFVHMLASNPTRDYLADATDTSDSYGYLQTEEFGYIGQSLGGIIGTAFATVEPRVTTAVLNVPGGGLADFVLAAQPEARYPWRVELLPEGMYWEALAAVQVIIGPADALYYAPYAARETPPSAGKGWTHTNMLLQQGWEDEVMPAHLTENLARALGAVNVAPVMYPADGVPEVKPPYVGKGDVTLALQQYYVPPQPEGSNKKDWDAHYMLSIANDHRLVEANQHQAARFLWTGLFEDKAEVIDGYTLVPGGRPAQP